MIISKKKAIKPFRKAAEGTLLIRGMSDIVTIYARLNSALSKPIFLACLTEFDVTAIAVLQNEPASVIMPNSSSRMLPQSKGQIERWPSFNFVI